MVTLTPFLNMFARSPITPLQKHMQTVTECAKTLPGFIDAVFAQNWQAAAELQNRIATLENDADELKKDIRLHLPKSVFLPVSRNDLLAVLTLQDGIANMAKDIAGLILGRQMQFPDTIKPAYQTFLTRSIDATDQALKAINELDELLETGFKGNEVSLVSDMIVQLDKIERDTDDQQVAVRSELFKLEATLPPVDVMFLYKIIEYTGELADRAHGVGGRLQLLLAK